MRIDSKSELTYVNNFDLSSSTLNFSHYILLIETNWKTLRVVNKKYFIYYKWV